MSYPRIFMVTAVLFAVNLLIPDPIILIDEVLLGLATVVLAKRKRMPRPGDEAPRPPVDGEARRF
nr:DUF6116 family protein [Luteimonas sp. XNQY3]